VERVAAAGGVVAVDHDVRHGQDVAAAAAEHALVAVVIDDGGDLAPAPHPSVREGVEGAVLGPQPGRRLAGPAVDGGPVLDGELHDLDSVR
jgi:hypothetical protein